jgi:hypothetical protein
MAKTIVTPETQSKTENQEPENSALEARRKAAEKARVQSTPRVQPQKAQDFGPTDATEADDTFSKK